MASPLDHHLKHSRAPALLGRALSRRAGSRCELCAATGVTLVAWEVPPVPLDADPDHALLLCGRCLEGVVACPSEPASWRFLEPASWSEVLPVQITAVRVLRGLAGRGEAWAREALDTLWLSPEAETWLDAG